MARCDGEPQEKRPQEHANEVPRMAVLDEREDGEREPGADDEAERAHRLRREPLGHLVIGQRKAYQVAHEKCQP